MNKSVMRCGLGWKPSVLPIFGRCGVVVVALTVAVWGETAPAQTADYSAGVKKLSQLGLPDTRQARYVKIESGFGRWSDDSVRGFNLTGNAWLLETNREGGAKVLVSQLRVVELVSSKVMEQRMKARMEALAAKMKPGKAPDDDDMDDFEPDEDTSEAMEEWSRAQSGDWKEADLKADIQSVIGYLNKSGGAHDFELKRNAAKLFLFAAHIHTRGQTAEANQIIGLLFQKAGDSRKLLGAVMSEMADVEYEKVYAEFQKTGSWAGYLSAMENLLSRFASAWHSAPIVEKVAAAVRQRAEQKTAPALTMEGMTAEDSRILDSLGKTNLVIPLHHPVFNGLDWLTSDPARQGAKEPKNAAPGPLDLIQQRGTKAIPLLVALLKDDWLVRVKDSAFRSYYFSDDDDETMSPEEIEARLESFSRPITRGDMARRILEPLVVGRDEERNREGRMASDELAQRSRAWLEKHKTENRTELLRQLLSEGRQEALQSLLSSEDATNRAAVEAYLLNTNNLAENLHYVTQYAQLQGASAKAFVQKYVAEVKKLPSLVPKQETSFMDSNYVKQREKQGREQVKALEDLISDKTAEQMLEELLASDKKWSPQDMFKSGTALDSKLAQEDPGKALTLLLQACVKAKDDRMAGFLLQKAGVLRWAQARKKAGAGAVLQPLELKIQTHADLWKKVLAQERSGGMQRNWGMGNISFKAQVASVIEGLYSDPKAIMATRGLDSARYLGPRVYEVTIQRAEARLAGKAEADLPPYPSKAKVSQERLAQIGQLLRDSSRENQHEIVGKLSLDELAALPGLVSADAKLNEKVVPGSHLIQTVLVTQTNPALAQLCQGLKGKTLDRKALESIIAECKKLAEQGTNLSVVVERRLPLAGVSLSVNAGLSQGGMGSFSYRSGRAGRQAFLAASLQSESSEGLYGHALWPVKMAAPPKADTSATTPAKPADEDLLPGNRPGFGESFKAQEEQFWKSFEKLLEPTRDACQPYTCTLSTQGLGASDEE